MLYVWMNAVADDLGFGDLGYTGSDIKTPVIDGLATAGQILGHYYVMHCCSPTRSALHTGRYNIRYGLQTQVIPNNKAYGLSLEETLMPQYMKRLGYATHAIGKVRRQVTTCLAKSCFPSSRSGDVSYAFLSLIRIVRG